MCNCNCKNGRDNLDFLLPADPSGAAEGTTTYIIGLTHNTCGGRNILAADPTHPVLSQLTITPIGTPIDLGNGAYCQECRIAGTVTYCPCGSCHPTSDYVLMDVCLPCPAATSPTLTLGTVAASPKAMTVYRKDACGCCCPTTAACTKQIALTTSIAVA